MLGPSITMTSFTDFIAFMVGSFVPLPGHSLLRLPSDSSALSGFCIFNAVAVLCDFVLQVTFFVSCLALNERRVQVQNSYYCCDPFEDNRLDFIPCIKLKRAEQTKKVQQGSPVCIIVTSSV